MIFSFYLFLFQLFLFPQKLTYCLYITPAVKDFSCTTTRKQRERRTKDENIFQLHLETFSNPSSIFPIRSPINSITLIPGKRNTVGGAK